MDIWINPQVYVIGTYQQNFRNILNYFYGYAESSSSSLITTKRTKDTKGKWPIILSFLRDLRVLRGEIIYDRIQLELFR